MQPEKNTHVQSFHPLCPRSFSVAYLGFSLILVVIGIVGERKCNKEWGEAHLLDLRMAFALLVCTTLYFYLLSPTVLPSPVEQAPHRCLQSIPHLYRSDPLGT